MFKKLLVPLDGSDQSERIGIWAYGMARGLGATVSLLAVVDPDDLDLPRDAVDSWRQGTGPAEGPRQGPLDQPVDPETTREPAPRHSDSEGYGRPSAVQIIESSVERARRYLTEEAERIQRQGGAAEINVVVGDPEVEIVRQAEDSGADLIAMATRRESALVRGIVGSVTDRVARNTRLPMLVAHAEAVQR
ncbi:MAG: universal stress protein, partial [Chloroflexota bacterium]